MMFVVLHILNIYRRKVFDNLSPFKIFRKNFKIMVK